MSGQGLHAGGGQHMGGSGVQGSGHGCTTHPLSVTCTTLHRNLANYSHTVHHITSLSRILCIAAPLSLKVAEKLKSIVVNGGLQWQLQWDRQGGRAPSLGLALFAPPPI